MIFFIWNFPSVESYERKICQNLYDAERQTAHSLQTIKDIDLPNINNTIFRLEFSKFHDRIFDSFCQIICQQSAWSGWVGPVHLEMDSGHNKKIGFNLKSLRPFIWISCVVNDSRVCMKKEFLCASLAINSDVNTTLFLFQRKNNLFLNNYVLQRNFNWKLQTTSKVLSNFTTWSQNISFV